MSDFSPQKFRALVCVRKIAGSPLLLAKFPWRKNVRPGVILRRPRLCGGREALARTICPVRMIWHRIVAGCACRRLLFQSLTRSNFNRTIKRNITAPCFPGGGRFAPHCFRTGGEARPPSGGPSGTTDEGGLPLAPYGFPQLHRYPDDGRA